ncbi:MAG TPA: hypothetical protein VIS77_09835 [Burkholderiales bacterium]
MEWLLLALVFVAWIVLKAALGWKQRNDEPPTPKQPYREWKDD